MNTDGACVVELEGLTSRRGSWAVFDNTDMRIPCGKVAGIIDPSGCDKTISLRLIASRLRPSRGEVWVNRQNLSQLLRGDLFDMRRQFGALFQSGALPADLDVFGNIAFPLRVHTQPSEKMIRGVVLIRPQAVGLRGIVELVPDELSGDMKRRVALARMVALNPQTLLYDEPFVGQDPIAIGVLVRLARLLNDALSIISTVVSHDLAETVSIASYTYIVDDGWVLGHGTPDVPKETDDPRIHQFVKGIPDDPIPFHHPARNYRADLPEEH